MVGERRKGRRTVHHGVLSFPDSVVDDDAYEGRKLASRCKENSRFTRFDVSVAEHVELWRGLRAVCFGAVGVVYLIERQKGRLLV